jgi:hypothetical protein
VYIGTIPEMSVTNIKHSTIISIRKRVVELHKRMGCAAVAAMCKAVAGPKCI